MKIGIIGAGAIGRYALEQLRKGGHDISAFLLPRENLEQHRADFDVPCVAAVGDLPGDVDHIIDCGGHAALREHGAAILRRGTDLITVSLGALADPELYRELEQAAISGDARLLLASGAIGALDCLRAARVGELESVTYVGRKPPESWRGSPAETRVNLDRQDGAQIHFEGNARAAATEYPKNANVAAAVALAGLGFDATRVQLIADPAIRDNVHEVRASGEFGSFAFEIRGRSLPDNPKSSALAAMSVVSKLEQETRGICF